MIYVIGSGPAGVSAAMALVGKGERVTMLDAGVELEPARASRVRRMSAQKPEEWDPTAVEAIKEGMMPGISGLPLKYVYGSDFPYRYADRYLPREGLGVGVLPSFGRGGLSNVWGAAVLPYADSEFTGWPIEQSDLAPHYESVLGFMGMSAVEDGLADRFPLFCNEYQTLPASRQAQALLADLNRNRAALRARGFHFGRSRLAVRPRGCAACGLCMYGCPYGFIYNTTITLAELARDPGFSYRGGVVVDRFTEGHGKVTLHARSMSDGRRLVFEGDRVYLGAGALATTKIVLESTGTYDRTVSLLDSQYFLLPWLRYRGTPGVADESLHTLSQVVIEIFDEELSRHSVHLQVYTYNDLYRQAIRTVLGRAFDVFRPALDAFLARCLVIQGYLHSDQSPGIDIRLRRDGTLRLAPRANPETRRLLRKVAAKLARSQALMKAMPLSPLMRIGEPGRGFHVGGTYPMSDHAGEFRTDAWGRPRGFDRVHLVDSSVLPTVNASSITLTIMANAHRIGAGHA